jgi:hypothetical protein
MRATKRIMFSIAIAGSLYPYVFASDNLEDQNQENMTKIQSRSMGSSHSPQKSGSSSPFFVEKTEGPAYTSSTAETIHSRTKAPSHHKQREYAASPFYAEKTMGGKSTPSTMEKIEKRERKEYGTSFLQRPVQIGDEVSIVRTSTSKHSTIKTSYDRKGNVVSIHAWDRKSANTIPVGIELLSEPIVKDEIESTVAKLRLVYNAFGEVISKSAWNKVSGEKIAVPPTVPFTNYINEDKYWAYVERQKLFDRSYEDLYLDKGSTRTRRLKKLVRYGNPFGIPEEIEVYEERPIIERHFEDAHYDTDAWVAVFPAEMSGNIIGGSIFAGIAKKSATYMEAGLDMHFLRHALEMRYLRVDNNGVSDSLIPDFDGLSFQPGSRFDFEVDDVDLTYRKEFIRSERGEFGLNWLFSLRYLKFDLALTDTVAAGTGNRSSITGDVILPMLGAEAIKNLSDNVDIFGNLRYFSLKDTGLLDFFIGGKYYFHPENVDDWRVSLGMKQYHFDAKSADDRMDMKHTGIQVALERGF